MRFLFVLILVGLVAGGPVLNTNFLSPSMPSYNNLDLYYFTIQSDRENVCHIDSQCQVSSSLSPQLQLIYDTCGAHDFESTMIYDCPCGAPNPALPVNFIKVGLPNLPNNITLWLRISTDSTANGQNIATCIGNYPILDCLAPQDLSLINCLINATDVSLDSQPCHAPLSDAAIGGIIIGSIVGGSILIILLVCGYMCACEKCEERQKQAEVYAVV